MRSRRDARRTPVRSKSTQSTYTSITALFVELPASGRNRTRHIDDEGLRRLQAALLSAPDAGDVIGGTGGLRKLRLGDPESGRGKRGGLRIVYFWWKDGAQIWLFDIYSKSESADLDADQRRMARAMLEAELEARRKR